MSKVATVKKAKLETVEEEKDNKPGLGHNAGPEFIRDKVNEIAELESQKMAILKRIRNTKADLKEKAGINLTALGQVLREGRMQKDVRKNFVADVSQIREVCADQLDIFREKIEAQKDPKKKNDKKG